MADGRLLVRRLGIHGVFIKNSGPERFPEHHAQFQRSHIELEAEFTLVGHTWRCDGTGPEGSRRLEDLTLWRPTTSLGSVIEL